MEYDQLNLIEFQMVCDLRIPIFKVSNDEYMQTRLQANANESLNVR